MPLEMDGSHPDTLYFAPEDEHIYRSTDFGATWNDLGPKGFTSPCDLAVVRDSANILYLGDSGPSRISRSTDGGQTWSLIHNGSSSEIPTIAISSLHNNIAYATSWGSGGVQKTVTYGASWSQATSTGSAWGVDIAKDDPHVVMFGVYGGGQSYLSTNAGLTFSPATLSGSNYGILAYDRSTFIAEQSGGMFKLNITYMVSTNNQQTAALLSPNGGENWTYGSVRSIIWATGNINNLKIEYKTSPTALWHTIAASVPASSGSYAWTIQNAPSTQARVRISDALDGTPSDSSDGTFTISVPFIALAPAAISFGNVSVHQTRRDTLRITNNGTAALVISSATTGTPNFVAGRTSFTVPPGTSDTLGVNFTPTAVQAYRDTLQLVTNSPSGIVHVPLSGNGTQTAAITVVSPNGGQRWRVGSVQNIMWSAVLVDSVALQYRVLPATTWNLIASGVPASPSSYAWTIPNTPAEEVLVRIVATATGSVQDESDAPFAIIPATTVQSDRGLPPTYVLLQNYPNPFNPSTTIQYGLPKQSNVSLRVFNALGQEVAQLVSAVQPAGWHSVEFSSARSDRELSSGIDYYRFQADDVVKTMKFVLIK